MKNLDAYVKNLYVSLEDIDEALVSKIKNLDNYKINECCGCCGCCDPCPCDCGDECCDKTCCEPTLSGGIPMQQPINQFGRFNSEDEIKVILDNGPKVIDLYDIHSQFARFIHIPDVKKGHIEPLYFGYKNYSLVGSGNDGVVRQNGDMPSNEANPQNIEQLYDVATIQNKKIYKAVNDIVTTFDFQCPVIQTKINGEVQVYVIKHSGTNGKENSIKTSLEEVAKILDKLDGRGDVQWSQVLDVSIDNIDDLYTFVITFTFNLDKVRETIKKEEL